MQARTTPFADRTVGDVVAEDYRRGAIFKRFGIDFCCGGGIKVSTACERRGIPVEELERELLDAASRPSRTAEPNPRDWELDFLADYIVNVHHRYVRENLPVLEAFASKVAKVHGPARPELARLALIVDALSTHLVRHMEDEETLIFPLVRALVRARRGDYEALDEGRIACGSIAEMEDDHERAGALMREARELTGGFSPPEGACNTWRALYAKLEEFEDDLHRHVHLENNLLFTGATRLFAGAA